MNSFNFNTLQDSIKQSSNYWKRYDDVVKNLSQEQKIFVGKQKDVLDAKQLMFNSFMDYLFDQYKEAFVSVAEGKYRDVVENYLSKIRSAADTYISRAEQLEKENEELKEKLKHFLEEKDESLAANGSRRSRKVSPEKDIQQGSNSGFDCRSLSLFPDQPELLPAQI